MEHKDYYQVMGLEKNASEKDIKMAYRRLARKYHPDLNKAADAEANFKDLGQAYEILKDPKKRQQYDQLLQQGQSPPPHAQDSQAWSDWFQTSQSAQGFDADLFESLFGMRRPQQGSDLSGKININLQEAYDGVVKAIDIPGGHGQRSHTVKVKIPAGVKNNQQIRLNGLGEKGQKGAPNGDLILTILINRDPVLDVVGNDVYLTLPITPWEAALGATIKVPTLGGKVDLKIPAHSQGGQTLRLKKRGLSGPTPGDQYVILKIVIPHPKNEAQTALYQKMAQEMKFNPRAHLESRHG